MPVAPTDFLDAAKRLHALSSACECDHRSATSRAYYAAYHHCLQWLQTLPPAARTLGTTGGVHQRLIDRLEKPHNDLIAANKYAKSKRAAKKLLAMRIRRRDADYELGLTLPALEAADQIAEAESVLNDLS